MAKNQESTIKYYKNTVNKDVRFYEDGTLPEGENWIEIDEAEYIRCSSIYNQISEKKWELARTDYRALKYAEGYYTEQEYAPYKAARQTLRDEINELEEAL